MCEPRASPSCFWTSRRPFQWGGQGGWCSAKSHWQRNVCEPPSWPELEASNVHQNWWQANDDAVELFSIDLSWQEAIITGQSLSRKQSFEEFWVPWGHRWPGPGPPVLPPGCWKASAALIWTGSPCSCWTGRTDERSEVKILEAVNQITGALFPFAPMSLDITHTITVGSLALDMWCGFHAL